MKFSDSNNQIYSGWKLNKWCNYVAILSFLASYANAAEWHIQPRLTVSETYTDNARYGGGIGSFGGGGRLKGGGEFITRISPGVNITGNSRRFNTNVNYVMENLVYARNAQYRLRNHLNANAFAELFKDHLFVDGQASISQQNAFLFGPQTLDNANLSGNLRNVYNWSISPYTRQRFKNFATGEVRYIHGEVSSNTSRFSSSSADTVAVFLNSGSAFRTLGWGLNYSHSSIDRKYSGSNIASLSSISLERSTASLQYIVNSRFNLIGTGGYERNSFISIRGRTSSPFWTVGFSWNPSKRTKVAASGGRRFFGNTYAASVDHRTRSSVWNLAYVEDISTFGGQSLSGGSILSGAMLGDLFSGLQGGSDLLSQGLPLSFSDPNNFLTNRLFLLRRLHGSLALNGKKNSLIFRGYYYSRKSFTPDEEDADLIGMNNAILTRNTKQVGGNVLWNHRLSPRTNANVNFGYIRTYYDETNQKDDNIIVSTGVNKQFTSNTSGSIMYSHLRRESDRNNGSYSSNIITATLNMNF